MPAHSADHGRGGGRGALPARAGLPCEPVSQRQLATAFGMSRTKVADLIKPLNGHQLDGATQ